MLMTKTDTAAQHKHSSNSFSPTPEQAELNDELSRLVEIVESIAPGKGKAVVVKICREFSGTHVYFLQEQNMFRTARDKWIIQQFDNGKRVPEIARQVKISERQIWNILGR